MSLPNEDINVSEEFVDPQTDESETGGETEGQEAEAEVATQQERTSKQSPEVDAAFREARLAKEELRKRDAQIAEQWGHAGITTYDQLMSTLSEQRLAEEAKTLSDKEGMSEELSMRLLKQEKELADMRKNTEMQSVQARNLQQKAELKDAKFFKELEPEIDELIKNPNVDVRTAYIFKKGEKMDELIAKAEKAKEAEIMKNLALKKQGKTSTTASPTVKTSQSFTNTKSALQAAWDALDG